VIARCGGERGFSLIEAIVVVTITGVLALLIIPLMPHGATRSLNVAERGVVVLDEMRGEREFRLLVRAVSPRLTGDEPAPLVEGNSNAALLFPNLPMSVSCARAGAPVVRLAVTRDSLVCASDGRTRPLLRWDADLSGALSYSGDGAVWRGNWNERDTAPFVRFELRRQGRVETAWVERAMGDLP
jgi:prepilin-type N-terminal cleavage/methylation domain-containing protein